MTSAERESLLKNLAESRERLLRMAQGLSREQLHYRLRAWPVDCRRMLGAYSDS